MSLSLFDKKNLRWAQSRTSALVKRATYVTGPFRDELDESDL